MRLEFYLHIHTVTLVGLPRIVSSIIIIIKSMVSILPISLRGENNELEKPDHTKLELGDSAKIKLPMWAQEIQVLKESDT